MALDFAKVNGSGENYPRKSYDGQEDQSYGFSPAFKLQTGSMRGTQGVGTQSLVIDSSGKRIGIKKLTGSTADYAVELNEEGLSVSDGDLAFISLTNNGFSITDGTITFISITKDGILMNDGTNDRFLLGKET